MDAVKPAGKADLNREKDGGAPQNTIAGQRVQGPPSHNHCGHGAGSSDTNPACLGTLLLPKPTIVLIEGMPDE